MLDPDPASIILTLVFTIFTILFQICDETFTVIGEARIHELDEDGNRKARILRRITENQNRFTAHMRIGTVFGAVGIAFWIEHIFCDWMDGLLCHYLKVVII